MIKANQDIRDYMADHSVGQKKLAEQMGVGVATINRMLKNELPQQDKEDLLNHIDSIAQIAQKKFACDDLQEEDQTETAEEVEDIEEIEEDEEVSVSTKFQPGDRVKIPSKQLTIGIVSDIWHSLVQNKVMYAVDIEGGSRGMYAQDQLEPAPLPITYTFEAYIDGNVAVSIMNAHQGDKTWVYARGHAHIIHDGEVGMAQAVSYASRRMFEALDTKQKKRIYFK
jgi:transcriptional regulator with XRE-family HTH domain